MKYLIIALFLFSSILMSCNGGNSDAVANEQEVQTSDLKKEIIIIDSTTAEIDDLKTEIESSTEELNNLLNDLN